MIVMKFGGSSVDTAESIRRVVGIVRGQRHRQPVVVVSAMARTTRRLLEAADAAAAGDLELPRAWTILEELRQYHAREARAAVPCAGHAVLNAVLERYFSELRGTLDRIAAEGRVTPRLADQAASFGELLSSAILSLALDSDELEAPWIDCRQVVITSDEFTRAKPIYGQTEPRLRGALLPHVQAGRVPVLGGYVGSTLEGATTTLGKEGSDFSAAIVGAAIHAEEVQIWTDVDGIMTADPKVVHRARRIRTLSFEEALELACSGAKKPHYGTLGPAGRADVPIRILNSWHLHLSSGDVSGIAEGTLIGRRNGGAAPGIKSIACKPASHHLAVRPAAAGRFLEQVWEVCERFRPALLVLSASEDRAELSLDRPDRLPEIRAALELFARVEAGRGRTVVTLVSEDLATSPGLAEMTLEMARPWEPRLLLRGVSAPCIRCLVDEREAEPVIAELHERVFPGPPGEPIE